jgi:hypothetical protein
MAESEIKALEMVRRIRDGHYAKLKDKSPEEILRFYREEAAAANAEAQRFLAEKRPAVWHG